MNHNDDEKSRLTTRPSAEPLSDTGLLKNPWSSISKTTDHEYSQHFQRVDSNWKKRVMYGFAGIAMLGALLGFALFYWFDELGVFNLDESKLKVIVDYEHADNSLVFDRNGQKIGEFFSDYHVYKPISKIPQDLINAVLSVEDRHFYEHSGIDFRGIGRAFFVSLKNGAFTQGGSTITQQVVRNFLLSPEKKLERKIKEAIFALELETRLSKVRILEIYLNALFLGQGAYGVGAAAERHFGKPIDKLELHELALIAGLFQSPSRFNPHRFPNAAKKRQLQVLKAMQANGFLTADDFKKWKSMPLEFRSADSVNISFAPYFIDAVQEQTEKILEGKVKGAGLRITTTLDLNMQKSVNEVIARSKDIFELAANHLIKKKNSKVIETAALIMDHHNGQVLALVGGRDFQRSQFNRALKAKRQPGSAFKPIVYSLGLMNGMNWSDVAFVDPVVVQDYRPQNSSHEYLTEATYYNALYRSINTPIIELGSQLGVRKVIDLAKKMCIKTALKPQAGTLLGGSELTLLDMVSAYSTLANLGVHHEPIMITRITNRDGEVLYEHRPKPPKKVLPPQIAYLMIHAMQAVFRFGTGSKFPEFASFAAGKTGTTNDAKDNWFCGMTDDITAVVWVGTDDNLPFNVSAGGNTLALPIWARIVERIREKNPLKPFVMPDGIEKTTVHPLYGYIDPLGIEMPFLVGRVPTATRSSLRLVKESGSYRDALDW